MSFKDALITNGIANIPWWKKTYRALDQWCKEAIRGTPRLIKWWNNRWKDKGDNVKGHGSSKHSKHIKPSLIISKLDQQSSNSNSLAQQKPTASKGTVDRYSTKPSQRSRDITLSKDRHKGLVYLKGDAHNPKSWTGKGNSKINGRPGAKEESWYIPKGDAKPVGKEIGTDPDDQGEPSKKRRRGGTEAT